MYRRRGFDWDEWFIEYEELVEAGEIDPKLLSAEDFVQQRYEDLAADAYDRAKEYWKYGDC